MKISVLSAKQRHRSPTWPLKAAESAISLFYAHAVLEWETVHGGGGAIIPEVLS